MFEIPCGGWAVPDVFHTPYFPLCLCWVTGVICDGPDSTPPTLDVDTPRFPSTLVRNVSLVRPFFLLWRSSTLLLGSRKTFRPATTTDREFPRTRVFPFSSLHRKWYVPSPQSTPSILNWSILHFTSSPVVSFPLRRPSSLVCLPLPVFCYCVGRTGVWSR